MKKLERHLHTMKSTALPYAIRDTLNEQAFEAQRSWREALGKKVINRNTFTQRSIQVEKAKSLNVNSIKSVVGSTVPWVEKLEEGQTESSSKKHGLPIPTAKARIGGSNKKLVRAVHYKSAIQLKSPKGGQSRRRKNAVALAIARRTTGFAFLNLGKAKGIFKVGKGRKSKAKMVWSLSKRTVVTKAIPMMEPAVQEAIKRGPAIHRENLIMQLRRHRIFSY